MKWVKQSVGYWCDDIKQGRCIGQGVCVALLDTGIARHPDLKGSVVKFCDFTKEGSLPGEKCYDDSGHGTHVAGILCGSGKVSAGAYAGMAPKAKLVVGKVLDKDGNGDVSQQKSGSFPCYFVFIHTRIKKLNNKIICFHECKYKIAPNKGMFEIV